MSAFHIECSHHFTDFFFMKNCNYNSLADLCDYVDFFFVFYNEDLNLIICNYLSSVRNKNISLLVLRDFLATSLNPLVGTYELNLGIS